MKSRGVHTGKKLAVRNRHQCMHQCRGAAGGASYIFFRKMHLVNHPFRLDSQRFLSYSIHMRALTLAEHQQIQQHFGIRSIFMPPQPPPEISYHDCARGDIAP